LTTRATPQAAALAALLLAVRALALRPSSLGGDGVRQRVASFGAMFALDPQDATGVAIPTFRVVTSLPTAGSSLGESVYVTSTRQGYVWDGVAWRDVTASPIRSFANDALLQADTTERSAPTRWPQTRATCTSERLVVGVASASASSPPTRTCWLTTPQSGSEAVANDLNVVFLRIDDNGTLTWQPVSTMATLEADILATQNIEGLQAVSTDSGRTYVNDGTRWVEQPIRHYDTEAELLADTPPPNTLAWANDTAHVFTYANNAWLGLNTGMDDPIPLGAFMDFPSRSIPNGWLECNGQVIPADAKYDDLRTLLGTANVPDLRGLFARAANDGQTLLGKIDWTTGRPKTNFTTSTTGAHTHTSSRQKTGSVRRATSPPQTSPQVMAATATGEQSQIPRATTPTPSAAVTPRQHLITFAWCVASKRSTSPRHVLHPTRS
jgi:microcystin-dependent protein